MKKEYLFAGGAVICWSSVAPITKLLLNDMSSTTVLFLTTAIASLSLFGYNIVRGNRKRLPPSGRQTTCDYASWDLWDFSSTTPLTITALLC